jgi:hypothetical protein
MRSDQQRTASGKFGPAPVTSRGARLTENQGLEVQKKFRITIMDDRRLNMLFYNNKKQFGWGVPADAMRDMLRYAISEFTQRAEHPTQEMITLQRRFDELERMRSLAVRHVDFEQETEQVDRFVEVTMRAGDLSAVRSILADYQNETKGMKDLAIKGRREMEFDKRWSRLYEGLNRGVSLTKFEED